MGAIMLGSAGTPYPPLFPLCLPTFRCLFSLLGHGFSSQNDPLHDLVGAPSASCKPPGEWSSSPAPRRHVPPGRPFGRKGAKRPPASGCERRSSETRLQFVVLKPPEKEDPENPKSGAKDPRTGRNRKHLICLPHSPGPRSATVKKSTKITEIL